MKYHEINKEEYYNFDGIAFAIVVCCMWKWTGSGKHSFSGRKQWWHCQSIYWQPLFLSQELYGIYSCADRKRRRFDCGFRTGGSPGATDQCCSPGFGFFDESGKFGIGC